jgi:2-succinyl-5-enolpyruvyl-6-hydroxy-3-cyclohexene-1-carboxylate synthase
MNPSTAFGTVFIDELVRCGLREAVLAPGSRSAPLALALADRGGHGDPGRADPGRPAGRGRPDLRLHVRIDERSAGFLALGLAKASRRPVVVVCTSGTAAAHLHAAVIEADEAGVPLIVLTADRPPELRGTGANQTIDQLKLYGGAVRWFCEAGVPEARAGMTGYWRSLACRSWAQASGAGGTFPGPVHVNVPLREPLVPGSAAAGDPGAAGRPDGTPRPAGDSSWPESLDGRPGGAPWTSFGGVAPARPSGGPPGGPASSAGLAGLELDWAPRGVIVCGDGDYPAEPLLELAELAGWPVLAEPSSNARRGPNALSAYPYLLAAPGFVAAHQPELIISAGRPGLSRSQLALLKAAGPAGHQVRHVVVAQGPGRWADPARTASDVVSGIRLRVPDGSTPRRETTWLESWRRADSAARRAVDAVLDRTGPEEPGPAGTQPAGTGPGDAGPGDAGPGDAAPARTGRPTEPRLARDLAAALPDGALLWAASSLPVRDLDQQMAPRAGLRVLASRGASGIDGLVSSAIGAALAHQAGGGGVACALLGDLAFLHDAPGLMLGPAEPRPDLCVVVVNNDGGGIFSELEQAAIPGPFERVFGTPHGADIGHLSRAAGLPYTRLEHHGDLPGLLAGRGLRIIEVRTGRAAGAALRARLREVAAVAAATVPGPGNPRPG